MAACGSSNAAGNKSDSSSAASSGKIEVVASINQWGSVAEDLGGSNVEVTNIMTKTNVEAHDYEPTSQDVAKFGTAKVAVVNGADYDPWATKAAQSTKATLVTAAETAGIKEGDNPHVWFSAKVRSNAADAITAAYQKADPSHKDDYAKLNKEWHAKEDQLESKIKETSAKTENLPYAATESVAWHLADDLKMTDATPKGYAQASANESEPTPADIKDFQDTPEGRLHQDARLQQPGSQLHHRPDHRCRQGRQRADRGAHRANAEAVHQPARLDERTGRPVRRRREVMRR